MGILTTYWYYLKRQSAMLRFSIRKQNEKNRLGYPSLQVWLKFRPAYFKVEWLQTLVLVSPVQKWGPVKKHINESCPDFIKHYSKSIGEVDLNDMLISIYCATVKAKGVTLEHYFIADISRVSA